MPSVLQPWVEELGLRHQGVIVSIARGCDTAPKRCALKEFTKALRGYFLVSFDPNPSSYIAHVQPDDLQQRMDLVLHEDFDQYPHHYIMHLLHAVAIIGYYCDRDREIWHQFYLRMCKKFHVNPETKEELDQRLGADEKTFAKSQEV